MDKNYLDTLKNTELRPEKIKILSKAEFDKTMEANSEPVEIESVENQDSE